MHADHGSEAGASRPRGPAPGWDRVDEAGGESFPASDAPAYGSEPRAGVGPASGPDARSEKGGGTFAGIRLLLCENPLPPLDEAVAAAAAELPRGNLYTEAFSGPLRRALAEHDGVPEDLVHVNAGSELILRQLFQRLGGQVHLLTPTYALFPEIAGRFTQTRLPPEDDFRFDLGRLEVPHGTTLVVVVNPNNPNGGTFDVEPLERLLHRHPRTFFLVDEAFVGLAGESVASWVPRHDNLGVTGTFSKAHSLAGFRVGHAVLPASLADDLNAHNDAYPLARASQAAALATLRHEDEIRRRAALLKGWTRELAGGLRSLGVRTWPTETYFFLADFAPYDARSLARELRRRDILVKPLGEPALGPGVMRITTARPEENRRVLAALAEILGRQPGPGSPGPAPDPTTRVRETSAVDGPGDPT